MPFSKLRSLSKPIVYLIGIFVVGVVSGIGLALLNIATKSNNLPEGMAVIAAWVVAVVLGVTSVWMGAQWMKNIDEAAQEAHKWSWFWGGSSGMAVGMVLIVLGMMAPAANLPLVSWFEGRTDPAAYMATGAIGMVGLMMVGYLLAWALWWFQRR